ncbi:MAG: hypothetical protein IJ867_06480, partial [Clostridia bacterium]|nr:hypothetical protein [Clostridia bacterium]
MFYPSYEDYMRDIFYFNGLQQNNTGYPFMGFNNQNLNDYFPSIYRIVNPVVQKVVSGNNYQFTNEDSVNNIVDVVLGITAGDINNLENVGNNSDFNRRPNSSQNCNSNQNSNSQTQENKETNALLRDLIKILTIKELQSKQNVRRFPYTYGGNTMP